jgi:hypothetical protein
MSQPVHTGARPRAARLFLFLPVALRGNRTWPLPLQ